MSDLEIITTHAIESDFYINKAANRYILSLILSFAIGAYAAKIAGDTFVENKNIPWLVFYLSLFAGAPIGIMATNLWMNWRYPNCKNRFNNLSNGAKNYDFTSAALNGLKKEACEKLFEKAMVGMGELSPEQCRHIGSIDEAEYLESIAVNAIPIHPYKSPFSRFEESGGASSTSLGDFNGYFLGLGGGILWGRTQAETRGAFEGSGEIAGIRRNTPIEYLMEDAQGNQFIVWDYHLPDAIKRRLDALSMADLMHNEVFRVNYSTAVSEHLDRLSSENAHLFYGLALRLGEVSLNERPPMRIYGQVIQKGDLPIVQLVGFDNKNGQRVLTQRHPVGHLIDGLQNELVKLGLVEYSKSPDLLGR